MKIAYLKNLQGYLWEDGYKSGAYATTLFSDVVPKLKEWKEAGTDLAIYSSGSVFAQKLLFGHVRKVEPEAGQKRSRADEEDHQDDVSEPPAKKLAVSSEQEGTSEDVATDAVSHPTQNVAAGSDEADSDKPDIEDLQYLIHEWFDTTNAGPKTESSSYKKIANDLFVSHHT